MDEVHWREMISDYLLVALIAILIIYSYETVLIMDRA